MLLSRFNVYHYLAARGLLARDAVLERGVTIKSLSGRNTGLSVAFQDGGGFFVKQPPEGGATEAGHYEREAIIFEMAAEWPELAATLPRLRLHERSCAVLVLELIEDVNLQQRQRVAKVFDAAAAAGIGKAMGRLAATNPSPRSEVACFPKSRPWALNPDWPRLQLRNGSPSPGQAGIADLILRYPAIRDQIEAAGDAWNEISLIHGDVKLENCFFDAREECVILIDWEFADWGDPLWDVAGFVQSCFNQWLYSIRPGSDDESLANAVRSAGMSLESLQEALLEFWLGYAGAALAGDADRGSHLLRVIRYAGARLLQTAFEWARSGRSLGWHSVRQAQAALNLMSDPEAARDQLLGQGAGAEEGRLCD